MTDRKFHHWTVTLADRTGQQTEVTFESYWNPDATDAETVGKAAAIQHGRATGKEYVYTAVTNID